MRSVLEELKWNPDIIALLVICLTLGVSNPPGVRSMEARPLVGMHRAWQQPAQTLLHRIGDGVCSLVERAGARVDSVRGADF